MEMRLVVDLFEFTNERFNKEFSKQLDFLKQRQRVNSDFYLKHLIMDHRHMAELLSA
jgi:hypothetical protein